MKVIIPSPRRNLYGQGRYNVLLGETYMGSEEVMFSQEKPIWAAKR